MITVRDVAEQMIDLVGADVEDKGLRDIHRAIAAAYREFPDAHNWKYLFCQYRFVTTAPYETGTITYVASTRTVTLSGGTFPTWAAGAALWIDDVLYRVQSRTSGTVLVLDPVLAPTGNLASDTAYSLRRESHQLPSDFRRLGRLSQVDGLYALNYVNPEQWLYDATGYTSTGTPHSFTIVGDPYNQGRLVVRMFPAPSEARTYDFFYQRYPRPLVVKDESTGSVSVTSGSAAVTGNGTAFTSAMVGSVFRLSSSATREPTAWEAENPAVHESRVLSVTDASNLTLESAPTTTLSSVKYKISDPVDVEAGPMFNAFLRCCESQLKLNREASTTAASRLAYREALTLAKAADFPSIVAGSSSSPWPIRQYVADNQA